MAVPLLHPQLHSRPLVGDHGELDIPKELVECLLRTGKAEVVCEAGKRTRSDVWKYFGRVCHTEQKKWLKDVVACLGCKMVYLYRSKSQGTSTLRHHKCPYVFEVLGREMLSASIVPNKNTFVSNGGQNGSRENVTAASSSSTRVNHGDSCFATGVHSVSSKSRPHFVPNLTHRPLVTYTGPFNHLSGPQWTPYCE